MFSAITAPVGVPALGQMISHRIHSTVGIAVSTWHGQVSDADLLAQYRVLYEDEAWAPGLHELVDVREANPAALSGNGLRRLATLVAGYLAGFEGTPKTAVLASRDEVFGLGRMYAAYSAESPESVQVFRDPQAALAWLEAPHDLLD